MQHRIFIRVADGATEVLRWSDDRLAAALRETPDRASLVGSIHIGRVRIIDRALKSAFVDLGLDRLGILPLKKRGPDPTEGEAILVQVRRDGWDEKGPKLSRDIASEAMAMVPNPVPQPPAMLVTPPAPWARMLLELDPPGVADIVCNRRVDAGLVAEWCGKRASELASRVRFAPERDWSPGREAALDEIAQALEETAVLPDGGNLLFEPVRTLTAVDVNSAGLLRSAIDVDVAAAREIPRQLSLRNLGGIIVVDFIDIENRQARNEIVEALKEAAEIDPAIEWIGNMSRLGLVEIKRRRKGPTLASMWQGVLQEARA